jgi:hypothetical protein
MVLFEQKDAQAQAKEDRIAVCFLKEAERVRGILASTQDRVKTEPNSLLPAPIPASSLGRDAPGGRPARPPLKVILLGLILPLLLIAGGISWLFHPQVTITITPEQRSVAEDVNLVAVTGQPTTEQVQARRLSASATQHTPTPRRATGSKTIVPQAASGSLTFYNLAPYSQRLAIHTVLSARNGVQVETLEEAVVPPASGSPLLMGQATVPAEVAQVGSIGNLPVHAITVTCCTTDGMVTARNEQPFTGGRDAARYTFVQQSDVDQGQAQILPLTIQKAKAALTAQLGRGAQVAAAGQHCTSATTSTPPVGSRSATVTVSVTAVCHEESYAKEEAKLLATRIFSRDARKRLGPAYQQGHPIVGAAQASLQDATQGTLLITIPVHGVFTYQLDRAALPHLAQQIAGMSWRDAQMVLRKHPGVGRVTITGLTGEKLPSASHIRIIIAG